MIQFMGGLVHMRTIREIAHEIQLAWEKPYFGAVPYLTAMEQLQNSQSRYFGDSATTIIAYFLANASTFKGEKAKALKSELKQHLAK